MDYYNIFLNNNISYYWSRKLQKKYKKIFNIDDLNNKTNGSIKNKLQKLIYNLELILEFNDIDQIDLLKKNINFTKRDYIILKDHICDLLFFINYHLDICKISYFDKVIVNSYETDISNQLLNYLII